MISDLALPLINVQQISSSAFIKPYDSNPSDVAFEINNWEKLLLTDNSDYAIITDNVGVGITDIYDGNYFTTSQSVLTIDPGEAGTGTDRLDVDSDSQIHLSYESINSTGVSVSVTETTAFGACSTVGVCTWFGSLSTSTEATAFGITSRLTGTGACGGLVTPL